VSVITDAHFMAQLPEETTRIVLELQQRLLAIVNEATTTGFTILEQYGETNSTLVVFDQLQNAKERAETYYSRFYRLLLQIAAAYPNATVTMLELLERSIEEAQATAPATEATIQEAKRDWNLL